MEIRPVRIEFFHADTRLTDRRADRGTDMTKLIATFRNFANAPKKKSKQVLLRVRLNDPLCYMFVCHQTP